MNSVMSNAAAPDLPRRALAEKAAARPDDIWLSVGTSGYVGNAGLSVSATAASPSVVENPNGIANQASPPKM